MIHDETSRCPRCDSSKMKSWHDLTAEECLLAEKLPASAEYSPEERKKHRICTRCWLELPEETRKA
jgi:hypothetical protein